MDSPQETSVYQDSRQEDLEDIEILKNLLEIRTRLRRETQLETDLD